MKKTFILLTSIFFMASCSTSKKSTTVKNTDSSTNSATKSTKADGSSFEKAISLTEKTEEAGVNAEYAWIKNNYSGYSVNGQALKNYKGKPYDIINITLANGTKKDIYFDISNFYGK